MIGGPPGQGPPPLRLLVNGERLETRDGATIADLVRDLGRDPQAVAVERNGELVPRAELISQPLHDGDRLEIVHFVQGG